MRREFNLSVLFIFDVVPFTLRFCKETDGSAINRHKENDKKENV